MNPLPEIPVFGEVIMRKKQRRKRQKVLIIKLFMDFAKNTTLHGLRYVTERGLTLVEKLFWLFIFLLSISICFYQISNVWAKWRTSPVIVSFNEHFVPVGMVPFPSVTFCPQMKVRASLYNYSQEYTKFIDKYKPMIENGTELNAEAIETLKKFGKISLVCKPDVFKDYWKTNISFIIEDNLNSSFVEDLLDLAPSKQYIFWKCFWRNKLIRCSKIFEPVLTSEGVCFNFNSLSAGEIFRNGSIQDEYKYLTTETLSQGYSVEDGYNKKKKPYYPRRGRENGGKPDLQVYLKEDTRDRDSICNNADIGYKIYVQHPSDLPQDSLYYYAALPGQVSSLALKFNMLTTSKTLKGYDTKYRQCYFSSDQASKLKYFKEYSQSNCRYECLSNYTFKTCGCVGYNMPHSDSRSICSIKKQKCVDDAKETLADKEMMNNHDSNYGECECLPACNSVQYDAEILKTLFNIRKSFRADMKIKRQKYFFNMLDKYNFSKIDLYFKEPRFVSIRRSELFGLTDFLANCGGLLGLFLGFSFLSLVEIVYFVSLRSYCALKRDLKEEKSISFKKTEYFKES